ncbi:hypothetical protein ACEPPN_013838 [Leptodophora sp. 'Broadleaf-Isolate-01']
MARLKSSVAVWICRYRARTSVAAPERPAQSPLCYLVSWFSEKCAFQNPETTEGEEQAHETEYNEEARRALIESDELDTRLGVQDYEEDSIIPGTSLKPNWYRHQLSELPGSKNSENFEDSEENPPSAGMKLPRTRIPPVRIQV